MLGSWLLVPPQLWWHAPGFDGGNGRILPRWAEVRRDLAIALRRRTLTGAYF